jgi:hypothetical protein
MGKVTADSYINLFSTAKPSIFLFAGEDLALKITLF